MELKEDHSRVVLTADMGAAMVVMDREDYTEKAISLLADTNTYKTITKDPTTKLKNKLSQTLRDFKNQGGLSDHNYRNMSLPVLLPQNFMASQNAQSWHPP